MTDTKKRQCSETVDTVNPSGLCLCGCGAVTSIAQETRRGAIKGQHVRYIYGHNNRGKAGKANPCWRGGRIRQRDYILIYCPQHPSATKKGYVVEHRLVMEQILGRYLSKSEQVHHRNGIRDDNRPENLELNAPSNHRLRTQFCQNCTLKKEIRLLHWWVKEQTNQIKLLNSKLLGITE